MKALIRIPGGVQVAEQPDPRPGGEEVVVAVHSCGICGSDVHAAAANVGRPGGIPGHEFSGTIAEVGAGVSGWCCGQRVAVNPLGGCGQCAPCQRGMPIRCPGRPNLGLSAPGGFAERVAVHQSQLLALPNDVPIEHGARVEPLAVSMRAIAESEARPGDNAIVFGVGPIGLHLVQALRALGSGTIIAVGRSSTGRRTAAAASGADVVLDSRETDVAEYVRERGLEIAQAFECSADDRALLTLSHAVGVGGTMVAVALGWTPAALETHMFVSKGLRLVSACAYGPRDFVRALELIHTGAVDVECLISQRVSLAEGPEAFLRLRRAGELVSVLVQPWR